jgi:hypothetical protein
VCQPWFRGAFESFPIIDLAAQVRLNAPSFGRVACSRCFNPVTGQVAQSVEQRIENPRVDGSIPPLATNYPMPIVLSRHCCFWLVARPPRRGVDLQEPFLSCCAIAALSRRPRFCSPPGESILNSSLDRLVSHAQDTASAYMAALRAPGSANSAYRLSGGETHPCRDMVTLVFAALGRPLRLLPVPFSPFRVAVALLYRRPCNRQWSAAVAERTNQGLALVYSEAARGMAFEPRALVPSAEVAVT